MGLIQNVKQILTLDWSVTVAHIWRHQEEHLGKMAKIKPKPADALVRWKDWLLSTGHAKDHYMASHGQGGNIQFPWKQDNLSAK